MIYDQEHSCRREQPPLRVRGQKVFAAVMLVLFFAAFHGLPLAYAVSIEEKVGARDGRQAEKVRDKKTEARTRTADADLLERAGEVRETFEKSERKDPRLACILSLIIPGAGHIYLRKDLSGIGFCIAAAASYSTTGYFLYETIFGSYKNNFRTGIIITGLLFLVSAIIHVVSIVEAYTDAEEMNKNSSYGIIPEKNKRFIAKIVIE